MRNKLLLRQQENEAQKRAEIAEANLKSERLRLDEIRAAGLDTIDYSVQNHRFIPPDLYNTQATQVKLTYAVSSGESISSIYLLY